VRFPKTKLSASPFTFVSVACTRHLTQFSIFPLCPAKQNLQLSLIILNFALIHNNERLENWKTPKRQQRNAKKESQTPSDRAMVTSPNNSFAKTICSICYEDLKPIIEDLQSITICGHVFHELWYGNDFACA
jgi:hypothetical protein